MQRSFPILLLAAVMLPMVARADDDAPDPPPAEPLHLKINDACSFKLVDNQLVLDSRLNGLRLKDQPAIIEDLAGESKFSLKPGQFRFENVRDDVTLRVSAWKDEISIRRRGGGFSVEYTQPNDNSNGFGDRDARLYVSDSEWNVKVNLTASDFATLRKTHPGEVMQFLGPVFRDLHLPELFPDAKVARQVLMPPAVDNPLAAEAELQRLIKQLDADSFKEREQALARLARIGVPAVTALEKLDRPRLTPQQQTEVDAFLRGRLSSDEITRRQADPAFAIDALYCDDAEVRAWALDRLKTQFKAEAKFDPKLDPLPQAPAIEAIRAQFIKPATQPAVRPAE